MDYLKIDQLDKLPAVDEDTLIVFDVDEVLITCLDQHDHPYAYDSIFYPIAMTALSLARSELERRLLEERWSGALLQSKRVLIEDSSPILLADLQKKGCKIIALTSCETGPFGDIPRREMWRVNQLQDFGFDFSHSFPGLTRFYLNELRAEKIPSPLYQNGILFSWGFEKGDVLKTFLRRINHTPKKVLVIDDLQKNLQSCESALKSMEIPCECVQFTGATPYFKPLDKELIKRQLMHLLTTGIWLSDEEAAK